MPRFKLDRDVIVSAGQRLLPVIDGIIMRFSATQEYQVFPHDAFAWTKDLEASTPVIKAEAERLLKDRRAAPPVRELSVEHHQIAVDDKWRSFFLWAYGVRIDKNCARCPETARVLDRVPGLLSAFYSVMLAGAHVPRHTGPTKAILTAHLGLIIPLKRERCHMRVVEQDVVWEEGRMVVFDDMYPHEVWNDTDEDRIILLLHVKRPLRFPGTVFRDALFSLVRASPFVQDGLRNLERWEKNNAPAQA